MTETSGRRALVVGASGLVGQEIVRQLLAEPSVARVTCLVRRPLTAAPRDARLHVVQADLADRGALTLAPNLFAVDELYCALGSTIKKAGSQDAFRKVDFGLPFQLASMARAQGMPHFLLVSALGADAASRVFYSRIKGELEEAIAQLGFPGFTVARPSMLLGDRTEFRLGEVLLKPLSRLLPAMYRGVFAQQVAAALVGAARDGAQGHRVVENAELVRVPR